MPTTASVLSQDDFGLVTDVTQTVNQEFYEWLLEQHNYFPDCTFNKVSNTIYSCRQIVYYKIAFILIRITFLD